MVPYVELRPFYLGPIEVRPFGVLVAIAIVVAFLCARRRARHVGLDLHVLRQLVRLCVIFGLIGAHLVHVLVYHPEEMARDPWVLLKIWAGLSSYGGFVGAILAFLAYTRWNRIPRLPFADTLMFGFFPAWLIARLGCATAHDHPGQRSNFFLAVRFPDGPRHDLGLYEFLLCFLWIPLLWWLGRKKQLNNPPAGTIVFAMCIAYAVPRFFLDFLRATDLPYSDVRHFGLTPAQYACLAFTAWGVAFFAKRSKSAVPHLAYQ